MDERLPKSLLHPRAGHPSMADISTWASLLFTPGNRPDLAAKAPRFGADAVIVDLEDAVPLAERDQARANIPAMTQSLQAAGIGTCVRVNAGLREQVHDLEAAVCSGLEAVMIPKAENAAAIKAAAEILESLEQERGLPATGIRMIALIETARGVMAAEEIAGASPRLSALALGPEDLALDLGVEPTAEVLTEPLRQLIWAARAHQRQVFGHVESIGLIDDIARLERSLETAARLGADGALCIHPQQVARANQAFGITEAALAWAKQILAQANRAEGVSRVAGTMVDRPVIERAERILRRCNGA